MARILVVGSTGQLGTAAIRRLKMRGANVRALVRSPEAAARFQASGVETVFGDLTDPASLTRACSGAAVIVSTANAAIPSRATDTFDAVERQGYRNLIDAAGAAGVRRFVYTSTQLSKYGNLSPLFRCKRETEEALASSGIDHVIFRADVFMDTAFAMMGSSIPLRGAEGATVLRPFGFSTRHFARIKDSIESRYVALICGDGNRRHAFICVDDVAGFLAAAAFSGPSGIHVLGGPEALTFNQVAAIYERLLGVQLRIRHTPALVFRIAAPLVRPFSEAGANLLLLNYMAAKEDSLSDPTLPAKFGIEMTSAETFLRGKLTLAAAA
jgi:uncharacterized protein YbjT (DUF2867 family)